MERKTPFKKMQEANRARLASMQAMRTRGWTLERIAQHWGLSKQRVHQILGESAHWKKSPYRTRTNHKKK